MVDFPAIEHPPPLKAPAVVLQSVSLGFKVRHAFTEQEDFRFPFFHLQITWNNTSFEPLKSYITSSGMVLECSPGCCTHVLPLPYKESDTFSSDFLSSWILPILS